jgi:prepilin-type N-terminal cleavage/methylation domain-containing protein
MRWQDMHISRDNKGTSLIEFIIAMAIASIVMSILLFFIIVASKAFRKANNEADLQLEAQAVLDRISRLAMEAYSMEVFRLSDEADEPVRYIFEQKSDYIAIIYDETGDILYLLKADTYETACSGTVDKMRYLAGNVDDFSITADVGKGNVNIGLSLKSGEDSISISKTVKMRNFS